MKDAIRGFELPTTLTMMRAFMGLIAQVSWTLNTETRVLMQEIRNKLTRPKNKKSLSWTEEEKEPLVLTSDWSRKGTGFELHIVSRECHTRNEGVYRHGCCLDGWRLAYAGGRFNTGSEANYAPVEGELLGIAIALHKSRFLTYGHPNLVVLSQTTNRWWDS